MSEEIIARIDSLQASIQPLISAAVKEAMAEWTEKVTMLEERCTLAEQKCAEVEAKYDSAIEKIENLEVSLAKTSAILAIQTTDDHMYQRKWNLIIHGIPGNARESELVTENKIRDVAKMKLKSAHTAPFAACHRLSQDANSGIIIKFLNLNDRNEWLSSGKNLKDCEMKIAISPDTPPILKKLKSEILLHRKNLPREAKEKSRVKYHKTWPYITLHLPDGHIYNAKYKVQDLINDFFSTSTPAVQDAVQMQRYDF
jgi:hypothetical protein